MDLRASALVVEVDPAGLVWVKSSQSGDGGGGCVEMAAEGDTVHVRTSRNRGGARLTFSADNWSSFLGGVVSGRIPGCDRGGVRPGQAR
ncbi:DUF397 domain-containing protein [Crossiella sp. CA198]|uniref:DUF397 domain-containing protein n=1 Tax=Crossiella sp. CA198 TaxID=3455607 RepID=UPI003F8CF9C4